MLSWGGERRTRPCCIPPPPTPSRLGQKQQIKQLCPPGGDTAPAASPCRAPRDSSPHQRQHRPGLGSADPSPQATPASLPTAAGSQVTATGQAGGLSWETGSSYGCSPWTKLWAGGCHPQAEWQAAPGLGHCREHPPLGRASRLQPSSTSPSAALGGQASTRWRPAWTSHLPPRLGFEVVPYQPGPTHDRKRLAEPGGPRATPPRHPTAPRPEAEWRFQAPLAKARVPARRGPPCCPTSSLPRRRHAVPRVRHRHPHTHRPRTHPSCRCPRWVFAPRGTRTGVPSPAPPPAFKQMWELKLGQGTRCLWLLGTLVAAEELPVTRGWSPWGGFGPLPPSKRDGPMLTPPRWRTNRAPRFGVIN